MTTVAACSGDSGDGKAKSVDTNGYCTQEFVTDYNIVTSEAGSVKTSLELKKGDEALLKALKVLKNSCEKFFSKHNNIQCKAEVDYKETTISSSDHTSRCELAQKIVDENTSK